MIPCHLCGKDASLNWVAGFPPAPDSMKMGLCAEHDSEDARQGVFHAWMAMLESRISTSKQAGEKENFPEKKVSVLFSNGSRISFLCIKCEPTKYNTLQILEKKGSSTFIPMDKIKAYTVKNLDDKV